MLLCGSGTNQVKLQPHVCNRVPNRASVYTELCIHCTAPRRVMAQVSCELVAPKENRPNEGIMFFNIELSPMASPGFEQGR